MNRAGLLIPGGNLKAAGHNLINNNMIINHLGSPSQAKYTTVIQSWAVLHSASFYLLFILLSDRKARFDSTVIVFSAEPMSTLRDIISLFNVSADRGQNHRPDFSLLIMMTSHQLLNQIYSPSRFVFVQSDLSLGHFY